MPIVTVVTIMVMNKYMWSHMETTNYMSVMVVMVIMLMKPVRMWMIPMIVVSPASVIPMIAFPVSVPVLMLVVVIMLMKLMRIVVIIHFSWSVTSIPGFMISPVIAVKPITPVVFV